MSALARDRLPVALRLGWMRSLFARLKFRTKFLLVGLVLAGPLSMLAGSAMSTYHERSQIATRRVQALRQGAALRDLLGSLALHRGLSAGIIAGGEDLGARLSEHQPRLLRDLDKVLALVDEHHWRALGYSNTAALRAEVLSLLNLPDSDDAKRNFDRHTRLLNLLLVVLNHVGTGSDRVERPGSALDDFAFMTLPTLAEHVARLRGWGSAVLTLGQYTEPEMMQYMQYAGSTLQALELVRADQAAMSAADAEMTRNRRPALLRQALDEVEVFVYRSMGRLDDRRYEPQAAAHHSTEGNVALTVLGEAMGELSQQLMHHADEERRQAIHLRNLAVFGLLAVALLLALVYAEFERSTVLRLRQLDGAARRLASGAFEEPVAVDGSDEIASLGEAIDDMRGTLQQAVAERAAGLAAQASDQAKTSFLARWSHDLRTPLNAVLGFAQVLELRGGPPLSAEQREDVRRIRMAAEHLLALVNDVLDMSAASAGRLPLRLHRVPLLALAQRALAMASSKAQSAGVLMHLDVQGAEQASAAGDGTRLLQVLGNLLDNAIKFNRRGGEVTLQLALADDGRVRLSVQDNGSGIPADQLDRLFHPFERGEGLHRHIPGNGLGLATAKLLVEAMGGSIHPHSTLGVGSRFDLLLPAGDELPLDSDVHPQAPAPVPPLAGRLAYVEDDAVNALLLRAMLAGQPGLSLQVFDTADAALEAARHQPFDLWLLDRHLADVDGFELLQQLRQVAPGGPLRAVMLSADAQPQSMAQALAHGCMDYWTKPIDRHALLEGLHRCLHRTHGLVDSEVSVRALPTADAVPRAAAAAAAADLRPQRQTDPAAP